MSTRHILKQLDQVHPPYSTILSLAFCVLLGLFLKYFRPEAGNLGRGFICGAIAVIVIKKALECSDKAVWLALMGKQVPKQQDSQK